VIASRAGFFFALGAYVFWGFAALYWKETDHIDPIEVTAHRALWSFPFAAIVLFLMGRTKDVLPTLKSPRKLGILFFTSLLITFNWGVFIWAVAVERTLEAAFAYYVNPLLTVFIGFVILGERFSKLQAVAIGIAALAVAYLTYANGQLPWISIALAGTFAAYGLLRKTIDVGPTQGFLVEVMLLFPFALAYLIWIETSQQGVFFETATNSVLLMFAGPVTSIPLILYAMGVRRLRLATIGIMQYIAPSIIFAIGIYVFGEKLRPELLVAFIMIWTALVIYSWSSFRKSS